MYALEMTIKDEHIDFQGILDSIYYAYYLEECHQKFLKDKFGVDIREEARKGINYVLAEYKIKFRASLRKGDQISVTCELRPLEGSRTRFLFAQKMTRGEKVVAEAEFVATCVSASGGRPFVPEALLAALLKAEI